MCFIKDIWLRTSERTKREQDGRNCGGEFKQAANESID
jgi:hypothetical protein